MKAYQVKADGLVYVAIAPNQAAAMNHAFDMGALRISVKVLNFARLAAKGVQAKAAIKATNF